MVRELRTQVKTAHGILALGHSGVWTLEKAIRTFDMGGLLITLRPRSSHCLDICKTIIIEVGTVN